MGFFKKLFGGKEPSEEEREQKRDANSFDTLKYNGLQALRMGKTGHAITYLTHALDIQEDEEAHTMLVNAYIRDNDLESAAEVAKELCELYPENANHPLSLAQLLFQLEQYDEMESACVRGISLDESRSAGHYLLAEKHLATGKLEEAEQEASAAITLHPESYDSYQLRARVYQQEQTYEEALADLEHLQSEGQTSDEVLLLRGELLESTGDDSAAMESYREVVAENPFMRSAYVRIARLQVRQEQYEDAETTINDAIEQNGEYAQIILARKELKEALGDTDGATEDAALASKLQAEEEGAEHKEANLEQEIKEKYSSINPFQ